MFNEMQTVLVQFKRSVGISLPAFVLEANLPPTADGKERPTSKNLIERKGVVPLAIPTALARANLRLADVRSRIRVNSVGKSTRLLTFTFATAAPNSEPRQELESTRAEFLESLLKKRWDEARVVEFDGKPTLRVVIFANEIPHPLRPRDVTDELASAAGFTVIKAGRK